MKRWLCGWTVIALLLLPLLTLTLQAADYETKPQAWADVRLRALYVQDGMKLSSDINPDFKTDWPMFAIPEAGGAEATSTVNMRGFALSPDGRYAYMSVLHGGGDIVRGMFVMETMTGKITAYDTRYDGNVCDAALPHFSYPKGLAADTRGYVYLGYTLSESYNEAYLRIARQEDDGTLTHISEIPVCSLGTPGDADGTKVGINGVAVAEVNGRMLCYVVTNYDHDALYCFDVTNPQAPLPNADFGTDGCISLATFDLKGYALDEALYLDVDTDGTVYLAISATDGRGGVAIVSPDGTSTRRVMASDHVYSVELVGNFLLCGSRTGGTITVLNRQTGRQITTLSVNDGYGERITRMQLAQDVLFVCDAGSVEGVSNAVYAAPLSEHGRAFLDEIVISQNRGYAEYETETEISTDPETLGETDPETKTDTVTETTAETVSGETETTAEAQVETNRVETEPSESATETDPSAVITETEAQNGTTTDTPSEALSEAVSETDGGCASAALLPCIFLLAGAMLPLIKRR